MIFSDHDLLVPTWNLAHPFPQVQHGLSFTSVDYINSNSDYHPLESIPEGVTVNFRDPVQANNKRNQIRYCKALYDFDGKNSSELTFRAGDVIKVLRTKTASGGDDGWWQVEMSMTIGWLFQESIKNTLMNRVDHSAYFNLSRVQHSSLKGEIPQKNVSEVPSMDSFTKIYIDLKKLWPKIWGWRLFFDKALFWL